MRKQFIKTMEDVGDSDDDFAVVLGDISVFGLRHFQERHPHRFFNIGICEQAMISFSAGLAERGWTPMVHTIAPFLVERAYEQIKTDLCYQKYGVNLVSVGSAFDYVPDGPTHHCWSDFGLLRILPGMQVVGPGSAKEFDMLFKEVYKNGNPKYFRTTTASHGVEIADDRIRFGKAIRMQEGNKLTIIAAGPRLGDAMAAAAGEDFEVIYVHTIQPLDVELIRASAQKTLKILCVEEHSVSTGLAAAVAEAVGDIPGVTIERIGVPNQFVSSYGEYEDIVRALGLDAAGISKRAREVARGIRR